MAELNAAADMLDSRDVAIVCQAARRFLGAWERAEELASHTDCFHGKNRRKSAPTYRRESVRRSMASRGSARNDGFALLKSQIVW